MGTKERRKREKEMRRRQIQDAASQVFMHNGFNSATMEDIANKAELSPGAIYTYFKSKEELLASLLLIPLEHLYIHTKKVYDDNGYSVEEKIIEFKEIMLQTFQTHQLMLRNIFHVQVEDTLSTISPELLAEINNKSKKLMDLYAGVYEDGVGQGIFDKGRGKPHADIFWGMFAGLVMWEEAKKKINPRKDFLRPTLDRAIEIFLRGVKKAS